MAPYACRQPPASTHRVIAAWSVHLDLGVTTGAKRRATRHFDRRLTKLRVAAPDVWLAHCRQFKAPSKFVSAVTEFSKMLPVKSHREKSAKDKSAYVRSVRRNSDPVKP